MDNLENKPPAKANGNVIPLYLSVAITLGGMVAAIAWFIATRSQITDADGKTILNERFIPDFVSFLTAIGIFGMVLLLVLYLVLHSASAGEAIVASLVAKIRDASPMQLVATLVGLLALGTILWVVSNGGGFFHESMKARGFLTSSVAIVTVSIALILVFYAVLSSDQNLADRFTFGKDVLMVFVGILGTIMGFYYGSDNKVSTDDVTKIASAVAQTAQAEWAIVAGTDVSAAEAKFELDKTVGVNGAARIYKRGAQFLTIIPGFVSSDEAATTLAEVKKAVNPTAFTIKLTGWCLNPVDRGEYIECSLPPPTPSPAGNSKSAATPTPTATPQG